MLGSWAGGGSGLCGVIVDHHACVCGDAPHLLIEIAGDLDLELEDWRSAASSASTRSPQVIS